MGRTEVWTSAELQGRRAVSCDGNMEYDGSLESDRKKKNKNGDGSPKRKMRGKRLIRKDS